jgi:hypothetical protein
MHLFWGVIGFLQAVFLPGAAVCALATRKRLGFARFFALSYVYSSAAGYVVAFLFLGLGIYTKTSMVILLVAELAILLYCAFFRWEKDNYLETYDQFKGDEFKYSELKFKIFFAFLICIAFVLVFSFYQKTVYNHIDSINTWDMWAREWAVNRYPRTYGDYAQLTPILMSIPYVYIGNNVIQLFSILNIQFCVLPILFALLTLRRSRFAFAAAAAGALSFWIFLTSKAIQPDINLVVAMVFSFVFLIWYTADLSHGLDNKFYLYSAFIAAGVAGVIKQQGLIWCLMFVIIAVYHLVELGIDRQKAYKILFFPMICSLAFTLPWYFYNSHLVSVGLVPTKIGSIFTNPAYYKGRTFIGRAIYCSYHYLQYSIFTLPAVRGLFVRRYFPISAAALVFMGGWIVFLSYGSANGKIPAVLACFPLGLCLEEALAKGWLRRAGNLFAGPFRRFHARGLRGLMTVLIVFLAVVLVGSALFSAKIDDGLVKSRAKQSALVGELPLQARVDYLMRTDPRRIMSCDGRLFQLPSIPDGYYDYCDLGADFASYGYLVLEKKELPLVDLEAVGRDFRLDYAGNAFVIYVNKSLY